MRGPLTQCLSDYLDGVTATLEVRDTCRDPERVFTDDDFQLALYRCYELHYRGHAGAHVEHEWDPRLLAWRAGLEQTFETALQALVPLRGDVGDIGDELRASTTVARGPSLSAYLLEQGSLAELREFIVHRSAYQLKEADPHSWALPRLDGAAKAAFVAIQMDEYGNGELGASHADLFATTMRCVGLDAEYGAYVGRVPASTLATVNLVTMMGLHHRLLPALVGHLASFEMTSVEPMSRYGAALRRHGVSEEACAFYDVHVLADAEHSVLALSSLAAPFVARHPRSAPLVVWGADVLGLVEQRFAAHLFDSWRAGRSSLRPPGRRVEGTPTVRTVRVARPRDLVAAP